MSTPRFCTILSTASVEDEFPQRYCQQICLERGQCPVAFAECMSQPDACDMLQRRAKKAGIMTAICNHSWRATGITVFLENGGAIEMAQYMAGRDSIPAPPSSTTGVARR